MSRLPIVLVHGYSASSAAFDEWRRILTGWGYPPERIHVCNYLSLSDEVTIPHLAMSFNEALAEQPGLNAGEPFDAVVHSTGMLVLRTWAVMYPESRHRLKHLIALAPASFGSPLAHKGRSYFGRMIMGNPVKGPDFREAGDKVLDALELGSSYTWDLALKDLMGDDAFYGDGKSGPFVSVFCGTEGYKGFMGFVNEPGTDGTVRMAGAALNSRKFEIDLRASVDKGKWERFRVAPWSNPNIPVVAIEGTDHSTIMTAPPPELTAFVKSALEVETRAGRDSWLENVRAHNNEVTTLTKKPWQQLVVRVVDSFGQPVEQYFLDFHYRKGDEWVSVINDHPPLKVHAYSGDPSLRCFHLDIEEFRKLGNDWALTVEVSSGSRFVKAVGWREDGVKELAAKVEAAGAVKLANRGTVEFFFPNTTTLVEIKIDMVTTEDEASMRLVDFVDRRARIAEEFRRVHEEERIAREKEDRERQEDLTRRLAELEKRQEEERA